MTVSEFRMLWILKKTYNIGAVFNSLETVWERIKMIQQQTYDFTYKVLF